MKDLFLKLKDNVTILVAIAGAISSGIFSFQSNQHKSEAEGIVNVASNLKNKQAEEDLTHSKVSFDRDFKFQLYNDVKDAIKSKDPMIQKASIAFVTSMVSDDENFKNGLLNVLGSNGLPDTKMLIDTLRKSEAQYSSDTLALARVIENKRKDNKSNLIDVCIFYCEETKATSYQQANAAKSELDALGKYNVYVRQLSSLINSKSGYQIKSDVIKYNNLPGDVKDETKDATTIQQDLRKVNGLEEITMHSISYETPWYISVFIY